MKRVAAIAVVSGALAALTPVTATMAHVPVAASPIAPSQSPTSATSATIAPSLSVVRPGAKAALTIAIRYAGGEAGVPSPVRRSVVHFPAGLTLDAPHLRSCSAARLLARGPSGCPAQSALGGGQALAEVRAGAVKIKEHIRLWAFLGTPHNGWATVQILGQGYTPQQRKMVVTGSMSADRAPYGEQLTIPFPPIPTLPREGAASLVNLSLTIGASAAQRRRGDANAVVVPSRCPLGGLPFGADFTYADGSSSGAAAVVPCAPAGSSRVVAPDAPVARAAVPQARAARTITLTETGHLHLVGKPHGFTLNEQGTATGTATGTIYVRLTAVSTSRVTAELSIYSRGSSISGHAAAGYRTSGAIAAFSGSLSIDRGSGSYAHAHGSGLRFSGTIQRNTDAVTVYLSGRLSD